MEGIHRIKIFVNGEAAVLIEKILPVLQLEHIPEHGFPVGDILVAEVVGQPLLIELFFKVRMLEKGFDLGAEEEGPADELSASAAYSRSFASSRLL